MKRALPMLAATALLGCSGATTAFTRTGPTIPAQPDGCDFAVVMGRPSEPHTELGTIELKYTNQTDWIYDESAFRRKVAPLVCQSGGDTVIAHTNDNALYTKGTVLTTKPLPKEPEKAAPPETASAAVESVAEPTAAPSPAPAAAAAAPAEKKEEPAKKEETAKKEEAPAGKKGSKKGASAKKEEDIRGKDGKIDIDKLL